MKRVTKRATAVLAALVLVVIGGGAAYAYWTGGGSGTGTATTGTSAVLVVNQTGTLGDMGPGVAAQTLSGDFDNSGDGPVYVATVTASIESISPVGCTADNYDLVGAVMTVDAEVPVGDNQGAWTGATLQFLDDPAVNQDICQNAVVTLHYAIG